MICSRCETREATTHQEWRESGDREHWANRTTDRCDRCAQDLREYVALPSISSTIVVDVPLDKPKPKRTLRVETGTDEDLQRHFGGGALIGFPVKPDAQGQGQS